MDLPAILDQLREELATLNESILAMERLQAGAARKPGRPPIWLAEARASQPTPKKRGRTARKPAAAKGE